MAEHPPPSPPVPPHGPTLEHRVDALEARYSRVLVEIEELKAAIKALRISQTQRARRKEKEEW